MNKSDRTLKNKYLNKKNAASFSGLDSFKKTLKIKRSDQKIKNFLSGIEAYSLHKPVIKKMKHRKTLTFFPHLSYGLDLLQIDTITAAKEKINFILICIDMFTRKCFTYFLKNKNAESVLNGIKNIFEKSKHIPSFVLTDLGGEFYNKLVEEFFKKNNILLYSVHSKNKSSQVERLIQTLRKSFSRLKTFDKNTTYKNSWSQVVENYNNRFHSVLKMSPNEAEEKKNYPTVLMNVYGKLISSKPQKPKYKVNDRVRISRNRLLFEKGSTEGWTREIFIIRRAVASSPPFYYLKDLKNEEIIGSFLTEELNKVEA